MGEQTPYDLELRRDDEILGTLKYRKIDWPWTICDFSAEPGFERYRGLFDEEWTILEAEGATERWYAAYNEVEALGLSLVYRNGNRMTDLIIHIYGNTADFKANKQAEKRRANGR